MKWKFWEKSATTVQKERPEMWFWPIGFGAYGFARPNFREFLENGFGKNPFVYQVVDKIADVSTQVPLSVEHEGKKTNERALLKLLKYPNEQENWEDFEYKFKVFLFVCGNVVIEKKYSIGFDAYPTALDILWLPDVDYVTVDGRGNSQITSWMYEGRNIDPKNILHIKYPDVVGKTHWGAAPLRAGLMPYEQSNNTFAAGAALMKNRGASGVLSPKSADMALLPKQEEALQAALDGQIKGADKFGKVKFSGVPVDYTDIGLNSRELEINKSNLAMLRVICSLYGADSAMFNDPENKTYANREEAEKSFYRSVIIPLNQKIDKEFGQWLIGDTFKLPHQIVRDYSKIDIFAKPNFEMSQKLINEVNAGIITAPEARAILYPEMKQP